MLLRQISSGHMIRVIDLTALMDLTIPRITGRVQDGEEEQDAMEYDKSDLQFLSGEPLPRCWTDPHYRDEELERH